MIIIPVCHTAKYLKWQSPTKTQLLIVMSWLLPAIIFGIMIYGWQAMTGQSTRWASNILPPPRFSRDALSSMSGSECSAPFLSNPYVNMGMYVAYYWTTLVAMLILYKVRIFENTMKHIATPGYSPSCKEFREKSESKGKKTHCSDFESATGNTGVKIELGLLAEMNFL